MVIDLFVAGLETTSAAFRWALLYLAHYQDVQEKLYQELKEQMPNKELPAYADRARFPWLEATIMEAQRIGSVSPMSVVRKTLAPTKLMGYDIPKDALIVPFLWNIHWDPNTFDEPDIFDPNRFLDETGKVKRNQNLMPFGSGKRSCIGEPLTNTELFLFLAGLFRDFRFFFPDNVEKPTLDPGVGFVRAPTPYKICVEPRRE